MTDVLEELRTRLAERVRHCGLATLTLNEVNAEIRDYQVTHPGLVDLTVHCERCPSIIGYPTDEWERGCGDTFFCPTCAKEET